MPPITRILAPSDLEPASDTGLRYAARLAAQLGAELVVLHVMNLGEVLRDDLSHQADGRREEAFARAGELLDEQLKRAGFDLAHVGKVIVYGDLESEIHRVVQEQLCDLMVITVKNRSRVGKMLMGSHAQGVILTSSIPVLTVHKDEE